MAESKLAALSMVFAVKVLTFRQHLRSFFCEARVLNPSPSTKEKPPHIVCLLNLCYNHINPSWNRSNMIHLSELTEDNWLIAASLSVKDDQKDFVAPAIGILARGYVYRKCSPKVFVIQNDETVIGLALVREFDEEPFGYDLQQFMIDRSYQGKGYGSLALELILSVLRNEAHYDHVEVCVKKEDVEALRLYEKHGFFDSGYFDEDVPDCVNMICRLF